MGRAFEYRRAAKEKRWDKMSKVFPKLIRSITLAVREGGPDQATNSKLRIAIQNAKSENMPKDNIDGAIKRACAKDAEDISEVSYEGKGPHGVLLFVDCTTNNTNRTVANLKTIFSKGGGKLVESGALEFMFQRKALIEFEVPAGQNIDEIELSLIDHGLDELEVNEGRAYAYAAFSDFGRLSHGVESLGIEASKSSIVRVPTSPVEFSETELEEIEKLIDRIEDDDDVQAVFTNIA
jgi:YebC/PmpR family DNA-binding regulatory protein